MKSFYASLVAALLIMGISVSANAGAYKDSLNHQHSLRKAAGEKSFVLLAQETGPRYIQIGPGYPARKQIGPGHQQRQQPQDTEPEPVSPTPPPQDQRYVPPEPSVVPSGGPWLFSDSDSRYLDDDDLRDLSKDQLWIARNEIFARRGYRFHTDRGEAYGRSLGSYYQPVEADGSKVIGRMNQYEKQNIELIKRYEKRR